MKKIKWFWIWQDEKEESWLHAMAQAGNHLDAIHLPGVYSFTKCQPAETDYVLDYWNRQREGFEAYLKPRTEAGWEFITRMNGWQYFAKPREMNEKSEAIKVKLAKADRYQQMMMFFVGFLPIMLLWYPILGRRIAWPLNTVLGIIFVIALVIFTITTFQIYRRISQLREI